MTSLSSGRRKTLVFSCQVCQLFSVWLKRTSSPTHAAASTVPTSGAVMLKIFGLVRLLWETWVGNEALQISVSGLMYWWYYCCVGGGSLTTQAPSHRSLLWSVMCIFMNNSYFHFTLLWFWIWLKSTHTANKWNQSVSQIHYSRYLSQLSCWNQLLNRGSQGESACSQPELS